MTDYYVRPTNGSDASAGTSFGAAWQTTQKALDTATAGDSVFLCNEATETSTVTIDADTNNGTAESPIVFEGRDGTDGSTEDTYTIQAIATWTGSSLLVKASTFSQGVRWKRIVFDANDLATRAFYDLTTGTHSATLQTVFEDCQFTQGTGDGFSSRNVTRYEFVGCDFDNNAASGFKSNATNDGVSTFSHCRFYNNLSYGCYMDDSGPSFEYCQFYVNTLDGLHLDSKSDNSRVTNCTFEDNEDSGLYAHTSNTDPIIIHHCTSSGNAEYGFEFAAADDIGTLKYMDYNHTYNNTSGATNLTGGMPGSNNQTGDPLFANLTLGSEDYTPGDGSPLDGTGRNGIDIGSRKAADPAGGGGGGTTVPQSLHPIEAGVTA